MNPIESLLNKTETSQTPTISYFKTVNSRQPYILLNPTRLTRSILLHKVTRTSCDHVRFKRRGHKFASACKETPSTHNIETCAAAWSLGRSFTIIQCNKLLSPLVAHLFYIRGLFCADRTVTSKRTRRSRLYKYLGLVYWHWSAGVALYPGQTAFNIRKTFREIYLFSCG